MGRIQGSQVPILSPQVTRNYAQSVGIKRHKTPQEFSSSLGFGLLKKCHSGGAGVLIETVRMMQAKLLKLQAGSIENYWGFRRQFQEFFLNSSASAMHKINHLYTNCDS